MGFTPPNTRSLDDPAADSMRRTHDRALSELQQCAGTQLQIVQGVVLTSGTDAMVAHGLGRAPLLVVVGAPRGASTTPGIVRDMGSADSAGRPVNRDRVVCLRADGYGVTVTVDVGLY